MRPLLPRCSSTALIILLPAYAAGEVRLSVPDVTIGNGGTTAEVAVVLESPELHVAGTQTDITVEPPLRFVRRANGRPDCGVNPAINKNGTSFAFLDACELGECGRMRTLVLALDNVDAIAVPAELYRCRLALDQAVNGGYPVHLSNAGASDPDGNFLTVETVDGAVFVGGVVAEGATFAIGDAAVCGQSRGTVEVTYTFGPSLSGASHVVRYDAAAPIASDDAGQPRCVPVPPLATEDATFTFVPDGCSPGTDCEGVQVFLRGDIGTPAIESIPLYRCDIDPALSAPVGTYPLRCTDARASNAGIPSLMAVCEDGSFTIGGCADPTPTATPEPSATATATSPSNATETPTMPGPGGGGDDDGGCAIDRGSDAGAWPLILALLMFRWAAWLRGVRKRPS